MHWADMIVRVFRTRLRPGLSRDFERSLVEDALPKLATYGGCTGVIMARPQRADDTQFLVLSFWESVEALQRFTGPNWEKPKVESPHLHAETSCDHYEVLDGFGLLREGLVSSLLGNAKVSFASPPPANSS